MLDTCPTRALGFVLTGSQAETAYGYGGGYSYDYKQTDKGRLRRTRDPEQVG